MKKEIHPAISAWYSEMAKKSHYNQDGTRKSLQGKENIENKNPFSLKREYNSIHKWNLRIYGKAKKCENSECLKESGIFQWALKKGLEHKRGIENYYQLCSKCHSAYDRGVIDIVIMSL